MKLFKYENYEVKVSEEALILEPFKKIWNRDKSKNKDKALMELGFIYFMEDPRSDYQYIVDKDERKKAIKEGEGFKNSWEPDKIIEDGLKLYSSFKTTSSLLLEDTRYAIDKLRKYLREIDLNEVDDKGKPIFTLNTITSTIKQIPALIKDLDIAEKSLNKEIEEI